MRYLRVQDLRAGCRVEWLGAAEARGVLSPGRRSRGEILLPGHPGTITDPTYQHVAIGAALRTNRLPSGSARAQTTMVSSVRWGFSPKLSTNVRFGAAGGPPTHKHPRDEPARRSLNAHRKWNDADSLDWEPLRDSTSSAPRQPFRSVQLTRVRPLMAAAVPGRRRLAGRGLPSQSGTCDTVRIRIGHCGAVVATHHRPLGTHASGPHLRALTCRPH